MGLLEIDVKIVGCILKEVLVDLGFGVNIMIEEIVYDLGYYDFEIIFRMLRLVD